MTQKSIIVYLLSFLGYVLLQAALLNKLIIGSLAFCFFYTGFLLLLPARTSRVAQLIIGFLIGLVIDIFASTLGVHTISCVLLMFVRPYWSEISLGDLDDAGSFISIRQISFISLLIYTVPLLLVHHTAVFLLDTVGVGISAEAFLKVVLSVLFTFFVLYVIQLFLLPTKKK